MCRVFSKKNRERSLVAGTLMYLPFYFTPMLVRGSSLGFESHPCLCLSARELLPKSPSTSSEGQRLAKKIFFFFFYCGISSVFTFAIPATIHLWYVFNWTL